MGYGVPGSAPGTVSKSLGAEMLGNVETLGMFYCKQKISQKIRKNNKAVPELECMGGKVQGKVWGVWWLTGTV